MKSTLAPASARSAASSDSLTFVGTNEGFPELPLRAPDFEDPRFVRFGGVPRLGLDPAREVAEALLLRLLFFFAIRRHANNLAESWHGVTSTVEVNEGSTPHSPRSERCYESASSARARGSARAEASRSWRFRSWRPCSRGASRSSAWERAPTSPSSRTSRSRRRD